MEFHFHIARASGNELIAQAMTNVKSYLHALLVTSHNAFAHREIALSFHARIVEGIARRDPEAAEQAMREHMGEAFQFVLSIISAVKSKSRHTF